MKQLLHAPFIELLENRVSISRSTRIVTIEQIAKNWGMSKITVYRYINPYYRNLSRFDAREARRLRSNDDKMSCKICTKDLKTHERCSTCTILIHGTLCNHLALKRSAPL